MTRKRYIKLIMGKGIQRNTAKRIAETAKCLSGDYAKAWNGETRKITLILDDSVWQGLQVKMLKVGRK